MLPMRRVLQAAFHYYRYGRSNTPVGKTCPPGGLLGHENSPVGSSLSLHAVWPGHVQEAEARLYGTRISEFFIPCQASRCGGEISDRHHRWPVPLIGDYDPVARRIASDPVRIERGVHLDGRNLYGARWV